MHGKTEAAGRESRPCSDRQSGCRARPWAAHLRARQALLPEELLHLWRDVVPKALAGPSLATAAGRTERRRAAGRGRARRRQTAGGRGRYAAQPPALPRCLRALHKTGARAWGRRRAMRSYGQAGRGGLHDGHWLGPPFFPLGSSSWERRLLVPQSFPALLPLHSPTPTPTAHTHIQTKPYEQRRAAKSNTSLQHGAIWLQCRCKCRHRASASPAGLLVLLCLLRLHRLLIFIRRLNRGHRHDGLAGAAAAAAQGAGTRRASPT